MSETVLVPTDGSEPATAALEFALETVPEAHIVVYHAINPLTVAREADSYTIHEEFWSEQLQAAKTDAEDLLEEAERRAGESDVGVDIDTEIGAPADAIVRYIKQRAIDHVVMGSHGRTGLTRVVLGSVAEKVIRRSPVPVTIVHGTGSP